MSYFSYIRCMLATFFLQYFVIEAQALDNHLRYLHTYHQPNSSIYYSYYMCSACGTSLNWLIEGSSMGQPYDSESKLGSILFKTNEDGTAVNSSVLLFRKTTEGGDVCFVSLLIVTTNFIAMCPSVQCFISTDYSPPNNGSKIIKDAIQSIKSDGVNLDYISVETTTLLSNEIVNNIFFCTVNGNQQLWKVNNRNLGLFTSAKSYDESLQNRVTSEGLVSSVAVLLSRQPLHSLMVLTNTSSFLVTCGDDNGRATLSGDISSAATTTEHYSNSSGELIFLNCRAKWGGKFSIDDGVYNINSDSVFLSC